MSTKTSYSLLADISLLLAAFIWGTGFVGSRYAIDSGMETSLILLLRFSLSAVVLGLLFWGRISKIERQDAMNGLIAGLLLFSAFYFQTLGLVYTTVSNNAFITSTNVIMVPFITMIFLRRRPPLKFILLSLSTFLGVSILNYSSELGLQFNKGDFYTLLCAMLFAGHIAFLGKASRETGVIQLNFLQMSVASLCSLVVFLGADRHSLGGTDFSKGILPVLYLGIFSTLVCFFIQTAAQKRTSSTKAAIFLSTEAFFGALFSVLIGLELFSLNMLVGGGIILFSVIASEIRFVPSGNDQS